MTTDTRKDSDILKALDRKFATMNKLALSVKQGKLRSLIIMGPPGVGKSHGIMEMIDKYNLVSELADKWSQCKVIRGDISPSVLYSTLYEFRNPGDLILLDDTGSIFKDETSVDLIKHATDTGKKRTLNWAKQSRMLEELGIPNQFEYKGGLIFITNNNLNAYSKKMQPHIEALKSRAHCINVMMTQREILLRIRQVIDGGMFDDSAFTPSPEQIEEIMEFLNENKDNLNDLSLRTARKLAELMMLYGDDWKDSAYETMLQH